MSGALSPVWRDGRAELSFVVEAGRPPVTEPYKKEPRQLQPEYGWLTAFSEDGQWSIGTVVLSGHWLRKTDGRPGAREGTVSFSGPLSTRDGVPQWLVARMSKLVAALNRALRELEPEFKL